MFSTEKEASDIVREFLNTHNWEYKEQYLTKSGKAIDYYVKAPHDGGYIFFGIECKRDLDCETNATLLADYLEQARAYSIDLGAPVFLAPVLNMDVSSLTMGGAQLKAMSALSIFGGRVNVGIMTRCERYYKGITDIEWIMTLRGAVFWRDSWGYEGFNPKRLNMVSSTGSKKERKDIKIWRPINA